MPRSARPITLESEIFDKKCQMLCLRYPHAPQDSSAEVTTPPFVQELYRLPWCKVSESRDTYFGLLDNL